MKIINNLGIDPGNGFIKMYNGTIEIMERMITAKTNAVFSFNNYNTVVELNTSKVILGDEAYESGLSIKSFVSESDDKRYNEEFIKLLLSFVYKNYCKSEKKVLLKNIVVGVPNNIYKAVNKDLLNLLNEKIYSILINDKLVEFELKKAKVVPQPFGTYFSDKSYSSLNCCIIDIGFGTVDYTFINKGNITNFFGTNNGIRKVLLQYQNELEEMFPSVNFNIYSTLEAFQKNSCKYFGEKQKIPVKLKEQLVGFHFDTIIDEIIERSNSLAMFDKVLFTGGVASEYISEINKLNSKNIKVVDNSQCINAIGFYNLSKVNYGS